MAFMQQMMSLFLSKCVYFFVFLFYNNDLATVAIVLSTQIVPLFEHILELGYLYFSSNMDLLCSHSNMIIKLFSSNISILSFDIFGLPQ